MPSIGLQHATGRMRMGARIDGPDVRILGNVDLEQLRIAGFTAKQVTAQVYNNGNQMTVDNLQGNFYDGQLMGRVIASMDHALSLMRGSPSRVPRSPTMSKTSAETTQG